MVAPETHLGVAGIGLISLQHMGDGEIGHGDLADMRQQVIVEHLPMATLGLRPAPLGRVDGDVAIHGQRHGQRLGLLLACLFVARRDGIDAPCDLIAYRLPLLAGDRSGHLIDMAQSDPAPLAGKREALRPGRSGRGDLKVQTLPVVVQRHIALRRAGGRPPLAVIARRAAASDLRNFAMVSLLNMVVSPYRLRFDNIPLSWPAVQHQHTWEHTKASA